MKMPIEVKTFERSKAAYSDHSARFKQSITKQFNRQYAHIYASRLWMMRPRLELSAHAEWGDSVPVRRLSELKHDEECIVIGTLFKSQTLKPSVLRELSEELSLIPLPSREKYVDEETDLLCLEDELQRITVMGVDVGKLLTGVVVALCGKETSSDPGKFQVSHPIVYQQLPEQPSVSVSSEAPKRHVLFLSGLEIDSKSGETLLAIQLLMDLVTGQLGDSVIQSEMSTVVRVVIAGNSISRDTQDRENANRAKYLTKKSSVGTKDAIAFFDDLLTQLAACVDVDVMPGEFDPTTFSMPQQPLHHCLLPQAARFSTLHCVTNPYEFHLDDTLVLGSSGQPVQDIYRFTTMEDHLEILERTLEMGHMAPTAPDTLACYPYADTDPFVIDSCPHVYFTGNALRFQQKISVGPRGQRTLLVAVPRFSVTRSCVLVEVGSLECREVRIDARMGGTGGAEGLEDGVAGV